MHSANVISDPPPLLRAVADVHGIAISSSSSSGGDPDSASKAGVHPPPTTPLTISRVCQRLGFFFFLSRGRFGPRLGHLLFVRSVKSLSLLLPPLPPPACLPLPSYFPSQPTSLPHCPVWCRLWNGVGWRIWRTHPPPLGGEVTPLPVAVADVAALARVPASLTTRRWSWVVAAAATRKTRRVIRRFRATHCFSPCRS